MCSTDSLIGLHLLYCCLSNPIKCLDYFLLLFFYARINSFHAIAVNIRPSFGVLFLKGRFSLKNGTYCPLFSHDTTFFKGTCLSIYLKVLPEDLYVFNRQPDIPVPTYLLKTTVEFWLHTKRSSFLSIFSKIGCISG
jgi:hypothetical protein